MSLIQRLFGRSIEHDAAHKLYTETINAARNPVLYTDCAVPDTPEGRFELLALMAFTVLNRLKEIGSLEGLAQHYFDIMTEDLDSNLREMGVGDVSVAKNVKKLAGGVFGRVQAYEAAIKNERDDVLIEELSRFVFREEPASDAAVEALADHLREVINVLGQTTAGDAKAGVIKFSVQKESTTASPA